MSKQINDTTNKILLKLQQAEITGNIVYNKLARREKDISNKKVLKRIAEDEKNHYYILKEYTNQDVPAQKLLIFWYSFLGLIMGYTFVIKIMEKNEDKGTKMLTLVIDEVPEVAHILKQEEEHEQQLIEMLDEERLQYIGSIVLGLNDALVELTGTIAGLTFAFSNNHLVALSGIITGVSATLSMAASNYLAERADENPNAFKSSVYTGIAYLITVVFLVLPYLLLPNDMYIQALLIMLAIVVIIIFIFNYYVSVTKSLPFKKQFFEMAFISLGVALVSFGIGLLAKQLLGIDI